MSITPRPGMLRFEGDVAVFYMAICQQCDVALPHPTEMVREVWATGHRGTGHTITYALDVRPDTGQTENRRRQLIDRLREKYSNPMPVGRGGSCAGSIHSNIGIFAGQPYVHWNGKLWHAECLDDGSYLRMATIADIAPGVLADVEPVTMKTWVQGEDWRAANPSYGNGPATAMGNANYVLSGMVRKMGEVLADDAVVGHIAPEKKPNARERRRQRREGKQWQRKS